MQHYLSNSAFRSAMKLIFTLLFVSLILRSAHSQPQGVTTSQPTPRPDSILSDPNFQPDPKTEPKPTPTVAPTPTPIVEATPTPTPVAVILVKRHYAPSSAYGSSATVAAGVGTNTEDEADVQVKLTDASGRGVAGVSVNAPKILDSKGQLAKGHLSIHNASIGPATAVTDSNGVASFSFFSSDLMGVLTLKTDRNGASATISQEWDDSSDWGDTPNSFTIGEPDVLEFKPKLGDGHPVPEIKGHQLDFSAENMTIEYWSKGKWRTKNLKSSNIKDKALIDHLAKFKADPTSDPSIGDYLADMTVREDGRYFVDDVDTNVSDITVWK